VVVIIHHALRQIGLTALAKHDLDGVPGCFDVVEIVKRSHRPWQISLIHNAFDATDAD
jgi:hypothetical protein